MDVPETPREGTRPFARMLLIGTVASIVGVALVLLLDWFPVQASTAASDIDLLWDWLMVVSVPVFMLVMTVAVFSVVKFRARPGDLSDGAPIHGNTRLEVIWIAIPFVIVSVLAGYGWVVLRDIEREEPGTMEVNVVGQQFAWTFEYPDAGGRRVRTEDLVLPVGQRVRFNIRAADVLHSFWVPAFRMKQDAVPGQVTNTYVTATREGAYPVVCAELCGIGHSTMRQTVRVVTPDQFASWLGDRGGGQESRARAAREEGEAGG